VQWLIDEIEHEWGVYFKQCDYTQYGNEYTVSLCLGECVHLDVTPARNHYAIYSEELDLKIERVIDEDHAQLLIEQAMRKCGVFPSVAYVNSDYGCFKGFVKMKFSALSDDEVEKLLKEKEEECY
jgi:hypothetical protein